MEQTIEDRVLALENQAYVNYLQINALVKELAGKNVINADDLIKTMDEINKTLYEATQEVAEEVESQIVTGV